MTDFPTSGVSSTKNYLHHDTTFEFEPVKHQDGVAFVSPVIKREAAAASSNLNETNPLQEKRSSMFVPRVTNKRIQLSNLQQQRNRIKRGSNVGKVFSATHTTCACPSSSTNNNA